MTPSPHCANTEAHSIQQAQRQLGDPEVAPGLTVG